MQPLREDPVQIFTGLFLHHAPERGVGGRPRRLAIDTK
jgi:hypothetical protein